ncbi:MAG: hypothetical protein JKY65_10210 [Planctomycetes bacterium]|nr:hypothetical protein [Planctomycetota bacterium]
MKNARFALCTLALIAAGCSSIDTKITAQEGEPPLVAQDMPVFKVNDWVNFKTTVKDKADLIWDFGDGSEISTVYDPEISRREALATDMTAGLSIAANQVSLGKNGWPLGFSEISAPDDRQDEILANGRSVFHRYRKPGIYPITLKSFSGWWIFGGKGSAVIWIRVIDESLRSNFAFCHDNRKFQFTDEEFFVTADGTQTACNLEVNHCASVSVDWGDKTKIASYKLDPKQDSLAIKHLPLGHSYKKPGFYKITGTFRDLKGKIARKELYVTVLERFDAETTYRTLAQEACRKYLERAGDQLKGKDVVLYNLANTDTLSDATLNYTLEDNFVNVLAEHGAHPLERDREVLVRALSEIYSWFPIFFPEAETYYRFAKERSQKASHKVVQPEYILAYRLLRIDVTGSRERTLCDREDYIRGMTFYDRDHVLAVYFRLIQAGDQNRTRIVDAADITVNRTLLRPSARTGLQDGIMPHSEVLGFLKQVPPSMLYGTTLQTLPPAIQKDLLKKYPALSAALLGNGHGTYKTEKGVTQRTGALKKFTPPGDDTTPIYYLNGSDHRVTLVHAPTGSLEQWIGRRIAVSGKTSLNDLGFETLVADQVVPVESPPSSD